MSLDKKTFSGKNWQKSPEINRLEDLTEVLFGHRNLKTPESIGEFLSPSLKDLHDPFLMDSLEVAMKRIVAAIQKKERIMVYGDFDTDGITSTVILVQGIKDLGGVVSYRIPDRAKDGHGLKSEIIDDIVEAGTRLMISCDCGINDQKEVEYATKKGVEVIITDHHNPDSHRFPSSAFAVLNPKLGHCKYPEKELSGAGIVFKLIAALGNYLMEDSETLSHFLEKYLEICAIGLVADCVPLLGENRILVRFGLLQIQNTQWPGLKALLERNQISPENIDAETIGFYIAPRLNAASRLGDVIRASALFLGDENQNYQRLTYLESLNKKRKLLTKTTSEAALKQVQAKAKFQFLTHPDWEVGILGLVASQVSENFGVPCFMGKDKSDGTSAFSIRAPEGYNIIEALESCDKDLFLGFGGHKCAGGFQVKTVDKNFIRDQLKIFFDQKRPQVMEQKVAAFIAPEIIGENLLNLLALLSPFGMGNPNPIFGLRSVRVQKISLMGAEKNHVRMEVVVLGQEFSVIAFFMPEVLDFLRVGDFFEGLFMVSKNFWKGEYRLQLRLIDFEI